MLVIPEHVVLILVGIERPEGRLVDAILEAGYAIVLIPTFAMKDLRRRYAVSGAKSDPGDAYVIADVVRTDGHRLRRLEPLWGRPGPFGRWSGLATTSWISAWLWATSSGRAWRPSGLELQ